jgi:hypothetical protein
MVQQNSKPVLARHYIIMLAGKLAVGMFFMGFLNTAW